MKFHKSVIERKFDKPRKKLGIHSVIYRHANAKGLVYDL